LRIGDITIPTGPALKSREASRTLLLSAFQKGDVLAAKVLHVEPPGSVLVGIRELALRARCSVPLEAGQEFMAEVVETSPQLILRVVSSGRSSIQIPIDYKALLQAVSNLHGEKALKLFSEALRQWLTLEGGKALERWRGFFLDPQRPDLRLYLLSSGLLLEAKLRRLAPQKGRATPGTMDIESDLKGLLLKAAQSPDRSEGLNPSLKGLLDFIRGLQNLLALSANRGTPTLYLPLWFWGFREGEWAELLLGRDPSSRGGRRSTWKIRIRLSVEGLGRVSVSAVFSRGVFRGQILAKEEGTAKLIQGALHLLERRLLSIGLRDVQLWCRHADDAAEYERPLLEPPEGLVRIRA
jgi:hypothetical protein